MLKRPSLGAGRSQFVQRRVRGVRGETAMVSILGEQPTSAWEHVYFCTCRSNEPPASAFQRQLPHGARTRGVGTRRMLANVDRIEPGRALAMHLTPRAGRAATLGMESHVTSARPTARRAKMCNSAHGHIRATGSLRAARLLLGTTQITRQGS